MEAKRIGGIAVVIEDPAAGQATLNQWIARPDTIVGRIGIPYREEMFLCFISRRIKR